MLTDKQRKGLLTAYSDEHTLYPDTDPMFGTHPKTIRFLVSKGLIEAQDEGDVDSEYDLTKRGRRALGMTGRAMTKPARMKTAVVRATCLLVGVEPSELKGSVIRPKQLGSAVWLNDEDEADYDDALMLVDLRSAGLGRVDELDWYCVAKLVGELGFPCSVEANRSVVSFWPED